MKNTLLEQRRQTILLSLSIMFILFLMPLTMAFEFDNVKSYDTETKTATINNAYDLPEILGGYEIAKAELNTPEMVWVIPQDDVKVAEFTVTSYVDYKKLIKEIRFYNLNDNFKEEVKEYVLKREVSKDIEVPDYKEECSKAINGSIVCPNVKTGTTHKESITVWEEITGDFKTYEKVKIGIFVDVHEGDKVEWIPNIAGVTVDEWAGFGSATLNEYYASSNNFNGLDTRNTGQGFREGFVGTNTSYVLEGIGIRLCACDTTPSAIGTAQINVYVGDGSSNNGSTLLGYANESLTGLTTNCGAGEIWNFTMDTKPTINTSSQFVYIVLQSDNGGGAICPWYHDASPSYGGTQNTYTEGTGSPSTDKDFEFYLWGSPATPPDTAPTITLNTPVDVSILTSQGNVFNCTATDDIKVQNITFYINGTLNQTNSSPLNNTLTGFTEELSEGYWNWSCGVCDNATAPQCVNATARTFYVNTTPTIYTFSPENITYTTPTIYFNATADSSVNDYNWIINYNGTNKTLAVINSTGSPLRVEEGYFNLKVYARNSVTGIYGLNASRNFSVNTIPNINITDPTANNSNYTVNAIYVNASSNIAISEWKLNYNGTNYSVVSSCGTCPALQDMLFNFLDGTHQKIMLYGKNYDTGLWGLNDSMYINVDTVPTIYTFSPTNTTYNTSTIYFNGTSNLTINNWIVNYNGTNTTLPSINSTLSVEDGYFNLLLYGRNSISGVYGLNATRNFTVDATFPTILVTDGNETQTYWNFSQNYTLNYTVTDIHLNKCWMDYNYTNRSIGCLNGVGNYTNFTLQLGINNATLWANDTVNNTYGKVVTWNYRMLYMNETYTASLYEGVSNTFALNLYTNGTDITIARLNYNGTDQYGTVTDNGGDFFTVSKTMYSPTVSADSNLTFYWNLTQDVFGDYNFTQHNQTVLNFDVDNCSTNTIVVYNFTLDDEDYQTELNETGNNTLAEVNFQLYPYGTSTIIQELNKQYNQTNPFAICINKTLTTEQFNADLQIRYSATNWETEYYHLQNATINLTTLNKNITLYDLTSSRSQVFEITYRDSAYRVVPNVLINISRKYIDEGIFKTVEISKTDAEGKAPAHLVLNDVVYTFTIMQYNQILQTYTNVYAVCQTPLVSTCKINLVQSLGSIDVSDLSDNEDFNYTMTYNETSKVITSLFTIPSGIPANVSLLVTQENALKTSVCIDYLNSTSGTLSCTIPNTIGNSTVRATLYKNGEFVGYGGVKLDQSASSLFGSVLVLLSVIVLITLLGVGLSDNPIVTLVFIFIGAIVLFGLNIVSNTGFIGKGATILWLLIIIVLALIKGAKRN